MPPPFTSVRGRQESIRIDSRSNGLVFVRWRGSQAKRTAALVDRQVSFHGQTGLPLSQKLRPQAFLKVSGPSTKPCPRNPWKPWKSWARWRAFVPVKVAVPSDESSVASNLPTADLLRGYFRPEPYLYSYHLQRCI